MGLSRRQFTREFKLAAVRRLEQGVSIAEAARALEVSPNVLHRSRREFRQAPGNAFPGNSNARWSDGGTQERTPQVVQQPIGSRKCRTAKLETEAREAKRGLWAAPDPEERRNERPCSQTLPEVHSCLGGPAFTDSPNPGIVPGVPGKQNAGVCRAQWFKRSWCPDSLGERHAGGLQCLSSRT
jgi:transposase